MGHVRHLQAWCGQMADHVTMGDRNGAVCSSMPGAWTAWEQACSCSPSAAGLVERCPWAHLSTHCSSSPASTPGALTPSQAASCSWQAASAAAHTSASSATRCRGGFGCPAPCLSARPASALSPSLAAAKLCSLVGGGTWGPGVRRVMATPISGRGHSSVDSCHADTACLGQGKAICRWRAVCLTKRSKISNLQPPNAFQTNREPISGRCHTPPAQSPLKAVAPLPPEAQRTRLKSCLLAPNRALTALVSTVVAGSFACSAAAISGCAKDVVSNQTVCRHQNA